MTYIVVAAIVAVVVAYRIGRANGHAAGWIEAIEDEAQRKRIRVAFSRYDPTLEKYESECA